MKTDEIHIDVLRKSSTTQFYTMAINNFVTVVVLVAAAKRKGYRCGWSKYMSDGSRVSDMGTHIIVWLTGPCDSTAYMIVEIDNLAFGVPKHLEMECANFDEGNAQILATLREIVSDFCVLNDN